MAEVVLGSGAIGYLDDADLHLVSGRKWQEFNGNSGKKYVASAKWVEGHLVWTFLHQLILPNTPMIDHRNGNGLDNRRSNLRRCTHTQNTQNRKRHKNNRSGFKGVYWVKARNRWRVEISAFGKRHLLGSFLDLQEAARAYDEAAIRLHGEFARLNFPRD